jgi:hypothetical protein
MVLQPIRFYSSTGKILKTKYSEMSGSMNSPDFISVSSSLQFHLLLSFWEITNMHDITFVKPMPSKSNESLLSINISQQLCQILVHKQIQMYQSNK